MIVALVPAAGQSRRMGQPKLLLPVGGKTLIAHVVTALRQGGADIVLVVAPPPDEPGAAGIQREAAGQGATVIAPPAPTTDMRATIEVGLDWLKRQPGRAPASLLLAPADSPGMTSQLVSQVIDQARAHPGAIVIPTFDGERGHPLFMPWQVATQIPDLPAGTGVNALLADPSQQVHPFEVQEPGTLADLDTPEDYRRWAP
jgi:molybdenum cofactor cytidylyltransferase